MGESRLHEFTHKEMNKIKDRYIYAIEPTARNINETYE